MTFSLKCSNKQTIFFRVERAWFRTHTQSLEFTTHIKCEQLMHKLQQCRKNIYTQNKFYHFDWKPIKAQTFKHLSVLNEWHLKPSTLLPFSIYLNKFFMAAISTYLQSNRLKIFIYDSNIPNEIYITHCEIIDLFIFVFQIQIPNIKNRIYVYTKKRMAQIGWPKTDPC